MANQVFNDLSIDEPVVSNQSLPLQPTQVPQFAPQTDSQPPRRRFSWKSRFNQNRKAFFGVLGLFVAVVGVGVAVVLAQQSQDIRNLAFTGFRSNFGGQVLDVTEEIRFASPSEIPQSTAYNGENGHRESFYRYAAQYQNSSPEYQEVPIPEILLYGQVFLHLNQDPFTSTLFARIVGFPESSVGEESRMWLETSTGEFVLLGTVDVEIEDGRPVAYATYLGPGNVKTDSTYIHFSHDTETSDATGAPGFISLTIKM